MRIKALPNAALEFCHNLLRTSSSLSYRDLLSRIEREKIGYTDGFSKAFNGLGHDAIEVIENLKPLQNCWALEHLGHASLGARQLLLEQIVHYQPTILWFQNQISLNLDDLSLLRKRCSALRTVVVHRAFPNRISGLSGADLVFCGSPALYSRYQGMGISSSLLYHAADQEMLINAESLKTEREEEAIFVGSHPMSRDPFYTKRAELLTYLVKCDSVKIYLSTADRDKSCEELDVVRLNRGRSRAVDTLARNLSDKILGKLFEYGFARGYQGKFWERLNRELELRVGKQQNYPAIFPLRPRMPSASPLIVPWQGANFVFRPPHKLFGRSYYEVFQNSQIVVNIHSDAAAGVSENMRMFEAPSQGACLLTENSRNLANLFVPGEEVIFYRDPAEAVNQIQWLLSDRDCLRKIASGGNRRVMRDHTWTSRAQEALFKITEQRLGRKVI